MREFQRPFHQALQKVFAALNADFLQKANCYFAGGTQISLMLNEFRVSRDVDLMCADRSGFRHLRETVSENSLGHVMRYPLPLAREVRADREGIRTFFNLDEGRIKFEIVFEARIDLAGDTDQSIGLPVLSLDCIVAEKLMANADRGLDDSTYSRDVIDLAFLADHHGIQAFSRGVSLALNAYGKAVVRYLDLALQRFKSRPNYVASCTSALQIKDVKTLRKGLSQLKVLLQQMQSSI